MLGNALVPVATVAPLVGIVLLFCFWMAMHRRKLRDAASRWGQRPPISDEEFLKRCDVPDEPFAVRAALAARAAIASLATVPPETISPDDSFSRDLSRLPYWDSLDWLGFVLEIERQSGGELRVMGAVAEGAMKAAGGFGGLCVKHIVRSVVTAAVSRPAGPDSG